MAWNTASVVLGETTKKSHYDRLRQNDQAIASGSFSFYGAKIWQGSQTVNSATLFTKKVTFTATAIHSGRLIANNTNNTIAMLTIDSAALAVSQTQTLGHSLGAMPNRVQVSLLCVTGELGFSAGDEVFSFGNYSDGTAGRRWTITGDTTNFTTRTDAQNINVLRKDTGAAASITMANWKFRIRYGL